MAQGHMRDAMREEMNRVWKMKTTEFIDELGEAFWSVSTVGRKPATPERLAAVLHRLYSMFGGSVRLNRECYALMETFRFEAVEETEQRDIAEGLKVLVSKCLEADVFEKDAFTWLAQRPPI